MAPDATQSGSDNLTGPALLRKIDQLREKNVGQHVELPQLVVVGDQSSGKSSVLASLTGIPFPRNLELCTRYAMQITSRRESDSRVEVTIIPGPDASPEHKENLRGYQPGAISSESFRAQFPAILEEVNKRMGIRTEVSSADGTVFSQDTLKIEICGPDEDYLTVIDVPGIFRNPIEGITTRSDVQLVQSMVRGYMKNSRQRKRSLAFTQECDKVGERTLGILTKPDLVREKRTEEGVRDLVLGKKEPVLPLGYYVVRNRGADDDDNVSQDSAENMFRIEPWSGIPPDCVGVRALKARLAELLSHITHKEFSKLRKEIGEKLASCLKEQENLGMSRTTERDQRLDDVFGEKRDLGLITNVANTTDKFTNGFIRKAHTRQWASTTRSERADWSEDDVDVEGVRSKMAEDALNFDNTDLNDFNKQVINLAPEMNFHDPRGGILDWAKTFYSESRGTDLGTLGGAILSSSFKEQSKRWAPMAKSYLSRVIVAIHRFMMSALEVACPDTLVRDRIWVAMVGEILGRYKAGVDQALFLVSMERERTPYTGNHYFNSNLQAARADRQAEALRPKARSEKVASKQGLVDGKLVVEFDSIKGATRNMSNAEHAEEEIHDILHAYYKVARKRFLDNVYLLAVDHYLLTGPKSPLTVFTQEWVIRLDAGQLEHMDGESIVTKERRALLSREIGDLEAAMDILRV